MSRERKHLPVGEAWIQFHRLLLGASAVIYLFWWVVVEQMLPDSFNPLGSRLAICASFLLVLVLSFGSPFVRRWIAYFYLACASGLTLHYFYLFGHNPGDFNWIVGSYITVVAVGATFERLLELSLYSVLVLGATFFLVDENPSLALAIPGMVTIIVLLQMLMVLRKRVEAERQGRIKAEGERASLEAISRAKSLFLANMSHELRTPLTGIVGFSELMIEAPELSQDSRENLDRICVNSQVLMEKVNHILILTEEDFGRFELSLEPLSISALVRAHLNEYEKEREEHVALSMIIEDPFVDRILGDSSSISRVVRSVLSNAIKFTRSGSIVVTLRSSLPSPTGVVHILIQVKDSGIGIKAADFSRIFDPFLQVQDGYDRPFGGVGLGLTIARKIARAMGGDVTIAESLPGRGTTVHIAMEAQTVSQRTFS